MYFTHTVTWPGTAPSRYRPLLAALVPGAGELQVPPSIFHYGDNKKPLQGLSPFRFSSHPRNGDTELVLTAVGSHAVDTLRREAWKITHLLSASAGRPLRDKTLTGYCELRLTQTPVTYLINHLIAERWERERGAAQNPDLIRRKILASLEAQCALLGRALPEGVDTAIYDVRPSTKTFATPIAGGQVGIGPVEVEFDAALTLIGPWHAGSLVARGFGRILTGGRHKEGEQ